MRTRPGLIVLLALFSATMPRSDAEETPKADAQALAFFESKVRPLLVEKCQGCHGPDKQKSGLRLDSRASLLKGGLLGPAIEPGKPAESLLIDAVRYGDLVQMPPKSKLPDSDVEALTRWIAMGAPWPEGDAAGPSATTSDGIDLEARARHWSFQPVRNPVPPEVKDKSWPSSPIDRFILAKLEARGLKPAPETDRRSLIRRLTFDLTGLPPTPGEMDAFLGDSSPLAYETLVDRLLASPRFGERWARHWLDLVRFAETSGHEFDYDILNAWRYRDYVIRAFNQDVPYNQFVVEHVAGDLTPHPRRRPGNGTNESVIGTGFFFLGEGTHSPVDVRDDEALRVDNQIDVFGKTFLALTIACARCHDHKFDPIRQKDYYALAGYLQSSRHQYAFIDHPSRFTHPISSLGSLKSAVNNTGRLHANTQTLRKTLSAAFAEPTPENTAKTPDPALLDRWRSVLKDDPKHLPAPLSPLLTDPPSESSDSVVFEDFDGPDYTPWTTTGPAFGPRPTQPGDWRPGEQGPIPVEPGQAHSGLLSNHLFGVLRSPTFTLEHPFLLIRARGHDGRLNLVVDGFEKIRSPIYGGLTTPVQSQNWHWYVIDVKMWIGHRAYLEAADGASADYTGGKTRPVPGTGFLALDEVRFSDDPHPPQEPPRLDRPQAEILAQSITSALQTWRSAQKDHPGRVEALAWLAEHRLLPVEPDPRMSRYHEIESQVPEPTLALAILDGTPENECVFLRGNYRTPGDRIPRRFLEVLGGEPVSESFPGSGRLDLAYSLVDPSNPLTARVMANRVWLHLFGRGIVPSPDDFGLMGTPPTHPALLDWLSTEFVKNGWSVKHLIRMLVLSRTYKMSTRLDPDFERSDPDNRLWHRALVRRLEAEAIRDSMLFVSGQLDETQFGPSVPPHLTLFMEGRGRPSQSGPLDGDRRRSLYLNVRRNFLSPMLLAFDFPTPATSMGRRNVSNVPAQALTLMNDPFVLDQARKWGRRVLLDPSLKSPSERIDSMYLSAFGRLPDHSERSHALAFLGPSAQSGDPAPWTELAHVLFNVKEFIFLY